MYVFMIAALMLVLPVVSIVGELGSGMHLSTALIGKWFVFRAVGIRLLSAGLRQILQPKYTAENILGIKGADSLMLVRETRLCELCRRLRRYGKHRRNGLYVFCIATALAVEP